MTILTGTFLPFSAIGNREDLQDYIYNISPIETPFQKMAGEKKIKHTLHEWQTQSLAAAAANAQLTGDNITTFDSANITTRVNNRTQIMRKTLSVSRTQNQIDSAGRNNDKLHQITTKAKELRRDIEYNLVGNTAAVVGNATTAPQMRSLEAFLTTNATVANGLRGTGGAAGTTSTAATDGTQRAITRQMVLDAAQLCWTQGGNPTVLMVGPVNKTKVSAFASYGTRFQDDSNKKLTATIDIVETDFGTLKVVPNRFQRERTAFVLDETLHDIGYIQKPIVEDLAKTGDAENAMIIAELTLIEKQEAGNCVIADLLTA